MSRSFERLAGACAIAAGAAGLLYSISCGCYLHKPVEFRWYRR